MLTTYDDYITSRCEYNNHNDFYGNYKQYNYVKYNYDKYTNAYQASNKR